MMSGVRTRWAAIGAAVAVTLGGGAFGVVRATVSSGERASYFPITPTRVLDTRNTTEVTNGTLRLTVEGQIDLVDEVIDRTVVPTDATAVAVNLTVTGGRKNGNYGYVTAYPCTSTADPAPNASSLNFENGVDIANALNITTSSNGSICLYVYGTADLIVDIAGYYADHDHDDRFYTKAQTDTQAAAINLALDGKADTTDLYQPVIPTAPHAIDSTGLVGYYTSIAIGTNGNPIISYLDISNSDLKVAACTNPICTTATTSTIDDTGPVYSYTSIVIGHDGNPIISYLDGTNGDLKVAACTDPTCTSSINTAIDTTGDVGWYASIAIGLDGNPIISYHDLTNRNLKVAACTNPTCTSSINTAIDTNGDVGSFASIAIGLDGSPIISYADNSSGRLKVAACTDPTCTSSINTAIDNTNGTVGWFTSIAIGINGVPIISYADYSDGHLKVAICSEPACTSSVNRVIDNTSDVGYDTSIAIDTNGNPIISYHDATNLDLKVAACTNPTCTTATTAALDTTRDVGLYTSIAIGINGVPIISYHDGTTFDLNVASAWWLAGGR